MAESMPTTTLTPPTATLVRPTTSLTAPVTSATKPVTDLDFSKFFASNSPLTPFTWYGSDYLKGWYTVGSVPPARTQFDALHNLSDKKDKYLLDYAKYHDDYEEWLKNYDTYLVGYDRFLKSTDDYLNDFANYLLNYAEYHDDYDEFLKSCIDFLNRIKAPIDSPAFTGTPTAPTPPDSDDSKRIATTAFVQSWVSALQATLSSHNSRISTNRSDIDSLNSRVSANTGNISTNRTDIDDLLGRVSDLESSSGGDDDGRDSLSATFGSGYFKISDGDDTFVIQYGTQHLTGYNVTFPIKFPNACVAFVGIDGGVESGTEHTFICSSSPSTTGVNAGAWNLETKTWNPSVRLSWIAVGY